MDNLEDHESDCGGQDDEDGPPILDPESSEESDSEEDDDGSEDDNAAPPFTLMTNPQASGLSAMWTATDESSSSKMKGIAKDKPTSKEKQQDSARSSPEGLSRKIQQKVKGTSSEKKKQDSPLNSPDSSPRKKKPTSTPQGSPKNTPEKTAAQKRRMQSKSAMSSESEESEGVSRKIKQKSPRKTKPKSSPQGSPKNTPEKMRPPKMRKRMKIVVSSEPEESEPEHAAKAENEDSGQDSKHETNDAEGDEAGRADRHEEEEVNRSPPEMKAVVEDGDGPDDDPEVLESGNAGGEPAPVPKRSKSAQKREAAALKRQARNEKALRPDSLEWYACKREERAKAKAKRNENPADDENQADDELAPCCRRRCCEDYLSATTGLIRAFHMALPGADQRRFWRSRIKQPNRPVGLIKKYKRTRQYYLDTPVSVNKAHQDWKNVTNKDDIINRPETRLVCKSFFRWSLGTSNNKLYQHGMTKAVQGSVISPVKVVIARESPKRALTIEVLKYLAEYESITLPQSGERILEITEKQKALEYARSLLALKYPPESIPSAKYLNFIWLRHEQLKELRVHRTLPFSKCDTCSKFDTDYSNTTDSKKRAEIIAQKREHKALISKDKDGYYSRGAKAVMRPADFLSLIVDGADQEKYSLPYRPRPMKVVDNCWRQKNHVMGAISHGRQVFAYIATDDIKQGNNVTIEVVHRVLLKTIKDEVRLPPVLFLQLDNTCKQNKAQYTMAYLHSLVDAGVFKKIIVSFLPVGHTHEDIDQFFSVLAKALKHRNCYTREDLADIIANVLPKHDGFKHPVHVEMMDHIVNYSGFVEGRVKMPAGITWWNQFRFFKHEDGVVQLQCRESTLEGPWGGVCNIEARDSIMTRLFAPGDHGRITLDNMDKVPPAQRTGNFALPEKDNKTKVHILQEGLKKFKEHYTDLNETQVASLQRDLDALGSSADILFHWTAEDITALYGQVADSEDDVECEEDAQLWSMTEGKYYLYRDTANDPPFRIAECVVKCRQIDLENGDPANPNKEYGGAWMVEMTHRKPKPTQKAPIPKTWRECPWKTVGKNKNLQLNTFQFDLSVERVPMEFTTFGVSHCKFP
jgi:hypothetical protein